MLGFIDDNPDKQGTRFQGYTVLGGREELVRLIHDEAVDNVVISMRLIDSARLRELSTLCSDQGIALSRLNLNIEYIVAVPHAPPQASQVQPARGRHSSGTRVVARP